MSVLQITVEIRRLPGKFFSPFRSPVNDLLSDAFLYTPIVVSQAPLLLITFDCRYFLHVILTHQTVTFKKRYCFEIPMPRSKSIIK